MSIGINAVIRIIVLLLIGGYVYSEDLKDPENLAYNFTKIADGVYHDHQLC